jgi:A/G-specific adenine glycosylase
MNSGQIIRKWYKKNRRDLPWRQTSEPYRIWISEVILQQTRIMQGLEYYELFLRNFPDVASLAGATEDQVLKIWQGLGYYSRARNLHRAAREVVEMHGGQLPSGYQGLLELKGIGPYTAAAIASICFGEARAVVDGNVSRVIARIFGMKKPVNGSAGERLIRAAAGKLMQYAVASGCDPGLHNQAMMEFGALQCVPHSPRCSICPLAEGCEAFISGRVEHLPVKVPKQKPADRWIFFYIFTMNGDTVVTQRNTKGIWRSLYQFPALESGHSLSIMEIKERMPGTLPGKGGDPPLFRSVSPPIRHPLTHLTLHARFVHVEADLRIQHLPPQWIRVPLDKLHEFAFPRLISRYMEVVKF